MRLLDPSAVLAIVGLLIYLEQWVAAVLFLVVAIAPHAIGNGAPGPRRELEPGSRYALFRWRDIYLNRLIYLRRLVLVRTPLFQVSLHWIYRPDEGRDMHDHPRGFLSIPLLGWYEEIMPDGQADTVRIARRSWRRWSLKRAADMHRISYVPIGLPCLTLVFWGPRRREWGFDTAAGWIDSDTYRINE